MSELVEDCPRCGAGRTTFDVLESASISRIYNWQGRYEAFGVCRHCGKTTVFILRERGLEAANHVQSVGLSETRHPLNSLVEVEGYVSNKDTAAAEPPEHLPADIEAAFREGAICHAVGCSNAAAAMFRLCIDKASEGSIPADPAEGPNAKIRRSLGLRLEWLFDNGYLPKGLKELSECIKNDGNDGAHDGSLTKHDADDLMDFTVALLERLYTEPERLKKAAERRAARRAPPPAG